jgi:L-lactate dehydrogenase complex protein LldG
MDKEKLLARVGAAVVRGAACGTGATPATGEPPRLPERPASCSDDDAPARAENIVGVFCAELESSRVGVSRVLCTDDLGDCLESLLPSEAGASVALSDAVLKLLPGFDERLARRGVRVVGPPGVRDARETGNGDGRAEDASARDARLDDEYRHALFECETGVTTADYAVADTGTLVLISGGERHRLISLLPPVHLCLLAKNRLLPDLGCLLERVREDAHGRAVLPHAMTLISGPSRTADIEQTLTTGVHGPHRLHVLLYES